MESTPCWGKDRGPEALPKYLAHVYVQAPSGEQHARKHSCLPVKKSIIPLKKAPSWTQMTRRKILLSDPLGQVKSNKTSKDIFGPSWSSPAFILPGSACFQGTHGRCSLHGRAHDADAQITRHHTNHNFAWEQEMKAEVNDHFETVFSALHIPLQKKFILNWLNHNCASKSKEVQGANTTVAALLR